MTTYNDYLQSEGWKAKRNMILNMWGNRCALCNEGGELHLHHRTYERKGNEDPYDLIPLCKKHHEMFHGKEYQSPRDLELEEGGRDDVSLVDATKMAIKRLKIQLEQLGSLGTPKRKENIFRTLLIMEDQYKRLTGEYYAGDKNA
jgi:hypothetical protein